MAEQLVECVPNFSEGRDLSIIKQITDQIESVDGVKLLDVDPGKATNRTVVTFVGSPEAVLQAAYVAASSASHLIDMAKHHGEHPRFGATDVCPLIPVANITMDETVEYARQLAKRLGEELGLTIYCYEHAAFVKGRQNLAVVRAGEYEGLKDKLTRPGWKPDFGPAEFNPRSGATAVGARDFLVAYNVNLNTTSTRRANAIAFDVREKGRIKRKGDPLTGEIVRDQQGEPVWSPGTLKSVKGIGWFIEEYGIAQISMNLTNIGVTPVHVAFDEVCKKAEARGVRVTGSELVGLIPLRAMLDAGKYFLRKQKRSVGVSDGEIIKIAVKSLGLDDLYPFKPEEKIIEYAIADRSRKRLVDMPVVEFVEAAASETPTPGGGSVSAAVGALGIALGTMVANLSSHKRGWDDRWEEFSDWAEKGKQYHEELLRLVDADTEAFNKVLEAFGLPNETDAERADQKAAVEAATKLAIEVPLQIMEQALESMDVIKAMASSGLPTSVSDAGVGALCARAAVRGAFLNVKINSGDLEDRAYVEEVVAKGRDIEAKATSLEQEILGIVEEKMGTSEK
jgi:glutamate formiminotransferase/formiminotetrahydrofolate cyclodeaminase